MCRAGVGTLTIVDRDVVEPTNLQRQTLFTEEDAARGRPKALAARDRLAVVNSGVRVRAVVDDFTCENAESIASDLPDAPPVGVIVDGTDNFETRYLLNDLAVSLEVPYIYGGAVGTTGMTMTIVPGATACLRCVFPEAPAPGVAPTCDTAGVLGPAVSVVAALQSAEALKVLLGATEQLSTDLVSIDLWTNEMRRIDMSGARREDCPCCALGELEFLEGQSAPVVRTLCGRNGVQVAPGRRDARIDLDMLAGRLAGHGAFRIEDSALQGELARERGADGQPLRITVFANGRAIVTGTTDRDAAKSVYARYVGV